MNAYCGTCKRQLAVCEMWAFTGKEKGFQKTTVGYYACPKHPEVAPLYGWDTASAKAPEWAAKT